MTEAERLAAFIPFIFEWEGTTFENDPDDPGGATKYGIDQRSHPNVDIRNLTAESAQEIYMSEWMADGCANLPSPLAECYFDTAVNCGLGRAMRWLDAAGGKDGNVGLFLQQREDYYHQLSIAHRGFEKFLRGWLNRVNALRQKFGITT